MFWLEKKEKQIFLFVKKYILFRNKREFGGKQKRVAASCWKQSKNFLNWVSNFTLVSNPNTILYAFKEKLQANVKIVKKACVSNGNKIFSESWLRQQKHFNSCHRIGRRVVKRKKVCKTSTKFVLKNLSKTYILIHLYVCT